MIGVALHRRRGRARRRRRACSARACILTGSIPVIDAETGDEVSRGIVPDWCVVVSATRARDVPRRRVRAAVRARREAPRPRASATTSRSSTTSCATTASRRDRRVGAVLDLDAADLFALTTALVAVPSESHHEAELADLVEARLRARAPSLAIDRIGNTVIARTQLGRDRRVVLGGHLDTVPANGNDVPRVDGDMLHGLGSADMKGGLAVLLRLAEELHADPSPRPPRRDPRVLRGRGGRATSSTGCGKVFDARPELLAADFAVLLEPTDGWVEAGCQGVLVLEAGFDGERAHTARPWMGSNAIHRAVRRARPPRRARDRHRRRRRPRVPRVAPGRRHRGRDPRQAQRGARPLHRSPSNRRFAPSYTPEEAEAQVRALLEGADDVEILQAQPAAPPNLTNPLVDEFVERPRRCRCDPKLGWTDVARFASRGIPARQLRPRRSRDRAHRGRVRDPRLDRRAPTRRWRRVRRRG